YARAEVRAKFPYSTLGEPFAQPSDFRSLRGALTANIERPFGEHRLVASTTMAGLLADHGQGGPLWSSDLVYMGGPVSGPGYDYHSIASWAAINGHLEWRTPAPFFPFSLGRFGRVPAQGNIAPYVHVIAADRFQQPCGPGVVQGPVTVGILISPRFGCEPTGRGVYPAVGLAYLLPFNLMRIDVARGLAHNGRWTFNVDVSREFWPIL
ncbi:MAG TPA: hypothetical protein VIP11_04235, partial [Gemmatimonadaceae bacterium]